MYPGLIAALVFLSVPASAQNKPVVAVFDIENDAGIARRDIERLTTIVATSLAASGRYKIVPPSELEAALRSKKKASYQACYDDSCQIEIGRELAAEKTLATKISKLGKRCVITMQLFDLKESAAARAGSAKSACGMDEVVDALEQAVASLTGTALPSKGTVVAPAAGGGAFDNLGAEMNAAKETPQVIAAREKKAKREAAENDWKKVEPYARTYEVPRSKRADTVRAYLQTYSTDNPKAFEAKSLLAALESDGYDPALRPLALKWRASKVAGVEFSTTEVTVGDYETCVKTQACAPPKADGLCTNRKKDPSLAVTCVSYADATAFCTFAGGRLPTGEEWMAEATNGGQRRYPWGDAKPSCKVTIMEGRDEWGCDLGGHQPPCSARERSVSGLCDMGGNVREWASDAEGRAFMMGQSYDATRAWFAKLQSAVDDPTGRNTFWGIRCARPTAAP